MKALIVCEGRHESGGALAVLVRRLAGPGLEYATDRVSRADIHAHHGKGGGYKKRAIRWLLEAQKRGFDALIFLIDQDHRPERRQQIDDAQEQELGAARRALGVAVKTFDAWMLADEKALTRVLNCPVLRQPSPETIDDPKKVCADLLSTGGGNMNQSEMYAALMEAIDIATLEARCPLGFAPFAERVRRL